LWDRSRSTPVKTPFGERERMLGGSAVHFSLAASFFDEVHVVGPVGDDFGEEELSVLERRDVDTSDIERVPGGQTFFWRGHYDYDLNTAHTDDTQLNVFGEFAPKLSPASRDCDVLFLANIQPDLQREVREQCEKARFVAMDSMNLWIETARDSLVQTIRGSTRSCSTTPSCASSPGRPTSCAPRGRSCPGARGSSWPSRASTGRPSSTMTSSSPCRPTRWRTCWTPPGPATRSPAGSSGYIASHLEEELSDELLRRAMAYGTALASYNVSEFGTERVAALTPREIVNRVAELQRITTFVDAPIALR
jgi:hypothetical protein